MDGAAERAAALDAARTRCHHGPSPGSAARGRTGRGAPTCNSARVSECKKGEATRGWMFSSCTTLINANLNNLDQKIISVKNMTQCFVFSKTQQLVARIMASFWLDLLGLHTSSPIKRRSWPVGFPTGLWSPMEIYLNLQTSWRNRTRQVFRARKSGCLCVQYRSVNKHIISLLSSCLTWIRSYLDTKDGAVSMSLNTSRSWHDADGILNTSANKMQPCATVSKGQKMQIIDLRWPRWSTVILSESVSTWVTVWVKLAPASVSVA